jgi:hypothetical protein
MGFTNIMGDKNASTLNLGKKLDNVILVLNVNMQKVPTSIALLDVTFSG